MILIPVKIFLQIFDNFLCTMWFFWDHLFINLKSQRDAMPQEVYHSVVSIR